MDSLLIKNIDAKLDKFNTEFEKKLSKLPAEMRFIRKIIYYNILPKVEFLINKLEEIKQTSNYDDNLLILRPYSLNKTNGISCVDLFENHNIKNMKNTKMIYTTLSGGLHIYDYESQKNIVDKHFAGARIDVLSTATVKYFDTYLTRIALSQRCDPNIHVFTYNHIFPVINNEAIINLSDGIISLNSLVSSIKFSKDSFFMSVIDYSGSVRVYKFYDIPEQNKGSTVYSLLFKIKIPEIENFTILPKQEEIIIQDKKAPIKNDKTSKVETKKVPDKKVEKADKIKNEIIIPDEINIEPHFIDNNDLTPLRKFNPNHPFVSYVQRKLIYDDKSGGFCSSLITIGVYISFYGTNHLKFISLIPYVTENMKAIFKVTKSRGGSSLLSQEEQMTLNSNMNKKEKEFISYLRNKLDSINIDNKKINKIDADSKFNELKTESINEINFNILYPITYMNSQKVYCENNYLGIGLRDGSIIVWDLELHTDKFFFQEKRDEITSITIDDKYMISGSKDGQIIIYNLEIGNETYKCYNFPYMNYPVTNIIPFFAFLSCVFDTNQNLCIYNGKESHKVAKLNLLTNKGKRLKISYFNKYICNFTDDNLIFICERNKEEPIQKEISDLIYFQGQPNKPSLPEYNNGEFINYYQNIFSTNLINKKNYIVIFKIKDIILKCYPMLLPAYKSGLSMRKIFKKYDLNNLPSFDKKDESRSVSPNTGFRRKSILSKKSEENLSLTAKFDKSKEIDKIKMDLDKNKKDEDLFTFESNETDNKIVFNSTQKKNILYYAFKGIKDRYQHKDQRSNDIQLKNENRLKDFSVSKKFKK